MKLLSRQSRALPGVTGVARVSRRSDTLLSRLGDGDIAVIDHIDIDRATADAMVKSGVTAVVNSAPSISGRYPNLGPEILVASGVILIDDVGEKIFSRIKDGSKLRIDGAAVYQGEELIAEGIEQSPESVADLLIEAKAGMSAQLEAFAANAIEYMKRERTLLLDGVGIPEISTRIAGRQVLIVAAGADTRAELKSLKKYISDYHPVLVGVDGGADALRQAGYKPNLIIGNPEEIGPDTLRGGAEVVIPADVDGHAPGLERLQDLGLGAVTFPATGTTEDLALLLVDAREASLIVTVGMHTTLTDLLDHKGGAASTFLVRMRVANKIVEAPAVARLYKARISWWLVAMLMIVAIAAIVGALLVSDVSHTYLDLARQWWNEFANWVRGLFR
ncbi:putative cytokinetic ring protein SteA [Nakamurella sp. PAMC28650]|uniref:putative cytokinetic ring protein SteA n=1 Tax=Nakamurella sp. PAMC28650 TaxID=2762325 RepID=UPI00164DA303|nr:putative cytokinetic ring protein SteA [Nakamurella sp. PAMC28650]QNK83341.1 thiamine pyrophosphokinase [Nakamurella sp. PAMC28650]